MKNKKELQLLTEGVFFDAFMLYNFLSKLVIPFEKTKAYQLGLIDKSGKILKHRNELTTSQEKEAFTLFDLLIWNLKKLLAKIPFGQTVLASYMAALFLIKEHKNPIIQDQVLLYESFADYMDYINQNPKLLKMLEDMITEDGEVPANNAGGLTIAGLGTDSTVVVKKKQKIMKRSL